MVPEGHFAVEPIDQDDIELLHFMRRSFSCQHLGGDCPVLADCPEGFYVCDAVVNILTPGSSPDLGNTAKQALRYLYDSVDCDSASGCPAQVRCGAGEIEACAVVMVKLGVMEA